MWTRKKYVYFGAGGWMPVSWRRPLFPRNEPPKPWNWCSRCGQEVYSSRELCPRCIQMEQEDTSDGKSLQDLPQRGRSHPMRKQAVPPLAEMVCQQLEQRLPLSASNPTQRQPLSEMPPAQRPVSSDSIGGGVMNWKEEAADKLRKFPAMEQSLRSIPLELKRLELDAQMLRGRSPEAVGGNSDPRRGEEQLMNNLMRRQELRWAMENARLWVQTTSDALQVLDPEEQLVLKALFCAPARGAVQQLCQQLEVEQSSVYRRRDKALYRFATALYGDPGIGS